MPHSSYSFVVSGMLASSIVVTTSTNGIRDRITAYRSGARFAIALISRLQALPPWAATRTGAAERSEEHTPELTPLMRISSAVFRLTNKRCNIAIQSLTTHDVQQ